ncbi:D-inositol-3-phosphate glycosyltransferase [subsurface metagenome]
MILVTTIGIGSMDMYSHQLAENLDVPVFSTDIYQKCVRNRNVSWLSPRAVRTIWLDWCFVRAINKLGDIVHLPNQHLGRYASFLRVPYIITVHDLIRYFDLKGFGNFIHCPNLRDRFYLNLDYKGIKKATRIIAVSQATKSDLMHYLDIPDERISVIYEGVDRKIFQPVPHCIYEEPYILFVGSEHLRKNFTGLVKAFSQLKGEPRFKDLKLVKLGRAGGQEADFRGQTMEVINALGLVREVIFTEFVSGAELPAYYSGAEAFILPSFYEGFGFPPLEAMACGCPVVTSNTSSLPEVVGEAGIMVDPYDTDSLAQAIRRVLTDDKLRDDMVSKGFEQVEKFSWEETARQTLEVYNEVADG